MKGGFSAAQAAAWVSAPGRRAAALGVLVLVGGLLRWRAAATGVVPIIGSKPGWQYYQAAGALRAEGILKIGIPPVPSAYRGIVYPGLIAVVESAGGKILPFQAVLGTAAILIVYACGAAAASPGAGLAAAALLAFDPIATDLIRTTEIESFYLFTLVCLSGVLLWWSERPSSARSFALGAAIGINVLGRSVLRLFPLYLLLLCALRKDLFPAWKKAALPLVAGFVIVLLPWIGRNAARFGEFVPFERGPLGHEFFMASAGFVNTQLNYAAFVKVIEKQGEPFPRGDSTKDGAGLALEREAFRRISRNPLPFLGSLILRVLLYGPFVLMLPWWAARRWAQSPKIYALCALHSYFALHLVMATSPRYHFVMLPVAYILAASLGVSKKAIETTRSARLAAWTAPACLGVFGVLYALGLFWIARDVASLGAESAAPSRSERERPRAVPSAAARRANDEGLRLLAARDWDAALRQFSAILADDPSNVEALLNGGYGALRKADLRLALGYYDRAASSADATPLQRYLALSGRAIVLDGLGRTDEARRDRQRAAESKAQ